MNRLWLFISRLHRNLSYSLLLRSSRIVLDWRGEGIFRSDWLMANAHRACREDLLWEWIITSKCLQWRMNANRGPDKANEEGLCGWVGRFSSPFVLKESVLSSFTRTMTNSKMLSCCNCDEILLTVHVQLAMMRRSVPEAGAHDRSLYNLRCADKHARIMR